jgi:hypothetical protein
MLHGLARGHPPRELRFLQVPYVQACENAPRPDTPSGAAAPARSRTPTPRGTRATRNEDQDQVRRVRRQVRRGSRWWAYHAYHTHIMSIIHVSYAYQLISSYMYQEASCSSARYHKHIILISSFMREVSYGIRRYCGHLRCKEVRRRGQCVASIVRPYHVISYQNGTFLVAHIMRVSCTYHIRTAHFWSLISCAYHVLLGVRSYHMRIVFISHTSTDCCEWSVYRVCI